MAKKTFPTIPNTEVIETSSDVIKRRSEPQRELTSDPFKIITYGNINHRKLNTRRQEVMVPSEINDFIDANLEEYGNRSAVILKMIQLGYAQVRVELLTSDYEIKL